MQQLIPAPAAAPPYRQQNMAEPEWLEFAFSQLNFSQPSFFLDSAGPITARSSRSLLSSEPLWIAEQFEQELVLHGLDDSRQPLQIGLADFASWLETFSHLPPQPGGAVLFGLLCYETFSAFPAALPHPLWKGPRAIWLLANRSWVYDRQNQTLIGPASGALAPPLAPHPRYRLPPPAPFPISGWREDRFRYLEKIALLKQDIRDGNFYQANFSGRFLGQTTRPPYDLYRTMRAINPGAYMGICGLDDFVLLCGSPELLLERRGQTLISRPIAGTHPRGEGGRSDIAGAQKLLKDEKERAEHLMLVDLIRNDLGRISALGSVRVPEYCTVETYSHVLHLVSEVESIQRPGTRLWDLLQSMFPGGTITGAPKRACMERLAQLEGEARGPYTGSLGFLLPGGDCAWNILIRSLMLRGDRFCFHGGGGIVADSRPEREFEESRQKCLALMAALDIEL
jgi:anthranilate/para-aminobenzoate synthase component I